MKIKLIGSSLLFGCIASANVVAGAPTLYDLYTCDGATFADGYDVNVDLTGGYEGVWFQVEDDADDDCGSAKKIKGDPDADLGFACNQNGNGNLVTSRIDDDTSPSDGPSDFSDSADNADLDVIESGADPRYAVVHADIFIPGSCAVDVGPCNHDSDDGTTPEQSCYDSGFGGGTSPEGYYGTAEASCENAFDSTGEGMFAEANEGGGTFSSNRPKDGDTAHMNWAMYVQLEATCQGTVAVLADASAPTCDSAAITRTAVADGGDWNVESIDAGTVKFTPTTDCQLSGPTCEDSTSATECELE